MVQQVIVAAAPSDLKDKRFTIPDSKRAFLTGSLFLFTFTNMAQQEISFQYHARYFKIGNINARTKQIWFVMHGYGQLAQYFIRKFAALEEHGICVIAPEGLSRFYLENFQPGTGRKNDRVGAAWMTRENREMDIRNYIQYLNTIYNKEVNGVDIPVTILGFSQGSATASRWVMDNQIRFQRLILWAGIFPPDMDFETGKDILKEKDIQLVYGKKDPFLTDERFQEMTNLSERLSANIKQLVFDGDHDIDQATLLKLI
jgi:predicted esterase